jgi:predicted nuclease of predicted toxin-antitoxin system
MNFLVDAQLPRRVVLLLRQAGHDAIHTLDLPEANRTTDTEINARSASEQRVVITKDADFVNSFLVAGHPYKLLLISTGNITNADLLMLLITHLPQISRELEDHSYLELSRTAVIIHR